MKIWTGVLFAFTSLLLGAASAEAQRPTPGAEVQTNPVVTGRLVDALSGTAVVRADRIGHESTFSDPLELHDGETIRLDLEADVRAIQLEAIDVDADPRCVLRPEEGRTVAAL